MKRIKIFKAYFILWLFIYFLIVSNLETFKEFFLSTLTFNVAIVSILAIGTFMILKASKDLTFIAGTFGVLMYKKRDLAKHIQGIEKYFPSNISNKIKSRVDSGVLLFSLQEKEEILTWIDEKFSNQNRYNNFFIGTVLMVGLLGTFTGLLGSIGSMANIVSSLSGGVDISSIMAQFSGPLSSMAVGFGSSLFGVISAILLSIKGYLLNKAQAVLLEGAENWLNSCTLEATTSDDKQTAIISSNTLSHHQKSFMDVFVDQISQLNRQMGEIASSNKEFKQGFLMTIKEVQKGYNEQRGILNSINDSLLELSKNSEKNIQLNTKHLQMVDNSHKQNQQKLSVISAGLEKNVQISELLEKNMESLNSTTSATISQLSKKDKILTDMVIKQENRDSDREIEFFQIIDTMEDLNKSIKNDKQKTESSDKTMESVF